MSIFNNNILAGAAAQSSGSAVHAIDQSIRFNDDDSPILKKTYSSAGTEETWTLSMWVKRGGIGAGLGAANLGLTLFSGGANVSDYGEIVFRSSGYGVQDSLHFYNSAGGSINFELVTTQLFRDPSAWYNIVCVMDTTNAVSSERMRIYVNGSRVTDFSTETYPSQNAVPNFNTATEHGVGGFAVDTDTRFFDGYLAEIVFIDGQALDPSSFGETNSSGIWVPKDVSGLTFGTNGFHIKGEDSSDLGNDSSGNNNDYTASGLAAHDQVFDTPTNNFCVLNQLDKPAYGSYAVRNLTGVNLQVTENGDGVVQSYGMGTMAVSSGKWYYEIYTNTYPGGNALAFGWIDLENAETATDSGNSWKTPGMNQRHTTSAYSFWTWGLNNLTSTGLTPFGQGVTIGVTTDFDNNTFTLTKDGSAYGSVDFDTTSPTYTFSGVEHKPILFFGADGASLATLNFGQDSTFNGAVTAGGNADENGHGNFKYAVPSGALALCTRNLGAD